ncbi:MAG: hypothetical protein HYY34_02435 [Chloroflexi bacterium]|nr:hypothetical protein [Chloroflexota bacterium]
MATKTALERLHVKDVVRRYGRCLELAGLDPHFHDISVGLYLKNGLFTVWTFSRRAGVEGRIEQIRDLVCSFGGMAPVAGTINQARYACGNSHEPAMKFLVMECVEKRPDRNLGEGAITLRDTKTRMTLTATPRQADGRWVYAMSAEGEGADNPTMRLRAVVGGFMRYGGAERVSPTEFTLPCGQRHDPLVRLLLPYARNVTSVEDLLDADALRGQMTTQTLGFSSSV